MVKPFEEQGHYTPVHDTIFDIIMPHTPANAFKVLMFIVRKTRGWKKESDVLRYGEIGKGTGIKSTETLSSSLKWLRDKKLILAIKEDGTPHEYGKDREAPSYSLNRDFELRLTSISEAEGTSISEVEPTSISEASNKQEDLQETKSNKARTEKAVETNAAVDEQKPDYIRLVEDLIEQMYKKRFNPGQGQINTLMREAKSRVTGSREQSIDYLKALTKQIIDAAGRGWFCTFKKSEEILAGEGMLPKETKKPKVEPETPEMSDEEFEQVLEAISGSTVSGPGAPKPDRDSGEAG